MLSRQRRRYYRLSQTTGYRNYPPASFVDERAKLIAEIDALDVEIAAREEGANPLPLRFGPRSPVGERIRQMDAGLEKAYNGKQAC